MRKTSAVAFLAALAVLLVPSAASARITEIGSTSAQGTPSCPSSPCLAVSRTSGFQLRAGALRNPYLAPRDGSLVAFSVALGNPSSRQISFFNNNLGGNPSARITVLHAFARHHNNFRFVVRAQSDVFGLRRWLGRTVQFPLARSLPVKQNDLIALTVPTWAPVLAVGLDSATTWRASRPSPCSDDEAFRQTSLQRVGAMAQFACQYKTARMTYSATLISTP